MGETATRLLVETMLQGVEVERMGQFTLLPP